MPVGAHFSSGFAFALFFCFNGDSKEVVDALPPPCIRVLLYILPGEGKKTIPIQDFPRS